MKLPQKKVEKLASAGLSAEEIADILNTDPGLVRLTLQGNPTASSRRYYGRRSKEELDDSPVEDNYSEESKP